MSQLATRRVDQSVDLAPPGDVKLASGIGLNQFALAAFNSKFFNGISDAARAVVKIQVGHELGIPPAAAMRGIYIFQDKIGLTSALLGALVKKSGRYDYDVLDRSDTRAALRFRLGDRVLGEVEFTMQMAQRAGLMKNALYTSRPRNMLFWRAMSDGVNAFCPDLAFGSVYHEDEVKQMEAEYNAKQEAQKPASLTAQLNAEAAATKQVVTVEAGPSRDDLMSQLEQAAQQARWGPDELDALVASLDKRAGGQCSTDDLQTALAKLQAGELDEWLAKRRAKATT